MAKLYRCLHDGCPALVAADEAGRPPARFEFEADRGACPACGATAPALVVELVPVHYLVPAAAGPIRTALGRRAVACDPARATLPQASADRGAVTCRRCKGSAAFLDHAARGVLNHLPVIEAKIAAEQGVKQVVQS